jgi:hypothetical protein
VNMLSDMIIQDVPVVVEPCVQVIEATCLVTDEPRGSRCFPVQLYRLGLDNSLIDKLPFVPSTKTPHVFCPVTALKDAPLLLVYDHMGRLHTVYKRQKKATWSRHELYDEVVGRVEVTPSVRFRFPNEKQQRRFLALTEQLIRQSQSRVINCDDVQEFIKVISRLRTPPVVVPVAIAADPAKNA